MVEIDDRRCVECASAKYKETFGEGHKLYICGKHKTAITEHPGIIHHRV